jgi:hypothetical protein
MSHSQFHSTTCLYLDMHGLIFRTSIWLLAGSTRYLIHTHIKVTRIMEHLFYILYMYIMMLDYACALSRQDTLITTGFSTRISQSSHIIIMYHSKMLLDIMTVPLIVHSTLFCIHMTDLGCVSPPWPHLRMQKVTVENRHCEVQQAELSYHPTTSKH